MSRTGRSADTATSDRPAVCLVSTPDTPACGIGTYTGELRRHLGEYADIEHVALDTTPRLLDALRAAWTAGRTDADVVHVQHEYGLFGARGILAWVFYPLLFLLTRLSNTPIVLTVHEAWSRETVQSGPVAIKYAYVLAINRLLRAVADELVFLSDAVQSEFAETIALGRSRRIPHGVAGVPADDVPTEPPATDFGYDPDDAVVVEPGYVSRMKGQDRLVDLAERCPELEFLIAGGARSDRDAAFFEDLSARLPPNVQLTGVLPDEEFEAAFEVADAVVLPYRKGGQSGVFNLCAAYQVPVAGSQCEYFQTMAERYDCVETFPGSDVAAMERATRRILEDSERREELRDGLRNFRRAEGFDTVVDRHLELYRDNSG